MNFRTKLNGPIRPLLARGLEIEPLNRHTIGDSDFVEFPLKELLWRRKKVNVNDFCWLAPNATGAIMCRCAILITPKTSLNFRSSVLNAGRLNHTKKPSYHRRRRRNNQGGCAGRGSVSKTNLERFESSTPCHKECDSIESHSLWLCALLGNLPY